MMPEAFFERFELLTNTPAAIEAIRRLVLELALQGRLVPQDAEEGSAEEVLAEIAAHHPQRSAWREYEPIDPPLASIPSTWRWAPASSLCDLQTGKRMKGGAQQKGVISIGGEHLKPNGTVDYSVPRFVSREFYNDMQNGQIRLNDTLMVKDGATTGKTAFVDVLPSDGRAAVNEHVFILRWHEPINRRLAFFFIRALAEAHVATKSAGVIGGIRREAVLDLPFPLPPLAEQSRIVTKLDALMALCGRLEAQLQEREEKHSVLARASVVQFADAPTPANLDLIFNKSYDITPSDLRKSIFALAVKGDLVPFSTDVEDQIVGDHIDFQNGYAFKSEWFRPSGVRLCRNANVSHGVLDWRESAFVDEEVAREYDRFALSEGDIVLSLDRPLIKTGLKVARVRKTDLPCLLLQRVAKPVPKHEHLDLRYFLLWLNSSEFVDSIDPGRSNGVPHISTRQVQRLPFRLPCLADQLRIVAKVEQLIASVDALEKQLATSHAIGGRLLKAMVAEMTAPDEWVTPPTGAL